VLEVRDGTSSGLLSVTYLPPGEAPTDTGVAEHAASTGSAGTVIVSARPDRAGDPAPFADRIDMVVAYLAPRL